MQQFIRNGLGIILNCGTDEEYHQRKGALIEQLRRDYPQRFAFDAEAKRALERQAEEDGMTLDEKLDELALTDYISHHRAALLRAAPPPDQKAAAGLAALGLTMSDLTTIAEGLDEADPFN